MMKTSFLTAGAFCAVALTLNAQEITDVFLVDATTNADILAIQPDQQLDLADLPNSLTIRAEAPGVGSVTFALSGPVNQNQTESLAPYALNGDSDGDFTPFPFVVGCYDIVVTPFTEAGGTGIAGTPFVLTFGIVDSTSATSGSVGTAEAYQPVDGIIVMEVENGLPNPLPSGGGYQNWTFDTLYEGFTGSGYYIWKIGDPDLGIDRAGSGILSYTFEITEPGEYQLHMRSRPDERTDHNDVWVRFPGVQTFKVKGGTDLGTINGWIKIYNSTPQVWGWQTRHVDFDPHSVWIRVNNPGVYTFEMSGRSTKFAIDRIVVRKGDASEGAALDTNRSESSRGTGEPVEPVPTTPPSLSVVQDETGAWFLVADTVTPGVLYQFYSSSDGNEFTLFEEVLSACDLTDYALPLEIEAADRQFYRAEAFELP